MGVNYNYGLLSESIKFQGTTTLDDFGGQVLDSRVKIGDIVLWSFISGASYVAEVAIPIDGEIDWLVDTVIVSNPCVIGFVVLDGNKIPN